MAASSHPEPEPYVSRRVLRDVREEMESLKADLARELSLRRYDQKATFAIHIAVEEAIQNAYQHGNRGETGKAVKFFCRIDDHAILVEVEDEGPGFDPGTVPDPTDDENIEIPSGRGIMLIRAYMDEVEYLPPGNRLRMVYRRPN